MARGPSAWVEHHVGVDAPSRTERRAPRQLGVAEMIVTTSKELEVHTALALRLHHRNLQGQADEEDEESEGPPDL